MRKGLDSPSFECNEFRGTDEPLNQWSREVLSEMYRMHIRGRTGDDRCIEWDTLRKLVEKSPRALDKKMLLMAAMIGCQMPLSSVAWASERFLPVSIEHTDYKVLGLLGKHTQMSKSTDWMLSVGRHF